jgi:hypothetical protein
MSNNTQTANLLNSVADFLDSLVIEKSTLVRTDDSISNGFHSAAYSIKSLGLLSTTYDIRRLASILSDDDAEVRFSKGFEMVDGKTISIGKGAEEAIKGVISNAISLAQDNEYISTEAAELHTNASTTITKAQALDLVKLLVSLESWSGPTKDILPDYLWLKVESQIKIFTDYILEG